MTRATDPGDAGEMLGRAGEGLMAAGTRGEAPWSAGRLVLGREWPCVSRRAPVAGEGAVQQTGWLGAGQGSLLAKQS